MSKTTAMVFAAGFGTRLRPLTEECPKACVPFRHRALLWHSVDRLVAAGVRDVMVNTHHLADQVATAVARSAPSSLNFRVVHEPVLLGTGGGLHNALRQNDSRPAPSTKDEALVSLNADIDFPIDLRPVLHAHRESGALATMVVVPHDGRSAPVEANAQGIARKIRHAPDRPAESLTPYTFTGVQVLRPDALADLPEEGCIVGASYRRWIDDGDVNDNRNVRVFLSDTPFRDLGTLPAYLGAHLDDHAKAHHHPDPTQHPIHPDARVHPQARLERTWVGPGAQVGPVHLVDCVVWPNAVAHVDARRTVFTPTQQVVVPE